MPTHFPEPVYKFEGNRLTAEGVHLGRKLFYEPLLSENGLISCGSCHHQEVAFSDAGKALSIGTQGKPGLRNSPALFNLAWMPAFMADGGINHIEIVPLAPITDSLEMNISLRGALTKLRSTNEYPLLFKAAFGDDSINSAGLFKALAQFMSTMVSANSKYDQVMQGKGEFTATEKRGLVLFQQNCASCHREPLFTDFSYRNNGLGDYSSDSGRSRITNSSEDFGKFKVPSLRNVELTAPYMHDGRISNLRAVLDHYENGVQSGPTLDSALQGGIPLSEKEKDDLIDFLRTLTDYEFIANNNFSEPEE